jgi:peptidoglycan/LPS O-acetylase OafA/YrhL
VNRITNIQGLRFIAALGVCVLHVGILNGELPGFLMGGAGVDLFFVISGFVMMLSAQPLFGCHGASKQFLYRRITRVVPLYWLATFVYLGLQLWFHGLSLSPPTPNVYPRTIAGLFFVPLTSKAFSPLLPVGWSLNFEMLFYFIFAFAIRFRQPVALILVASTICTLSIIGLTCFPVQPNGIPANGLAAYVFNATAIEFVYGIGIGYFKIKKKSIPTALAALLFIGGFFALYIIARYPEPYRELNNGIPAAAIVAGAVFLPSIKSRAVNLLGDASYALYLLHWILFWFVHSLPQPVILTIAVVLSIAIRLLIEVPLLKWLRRFSRPPALSGVAPETASTS